MKKVNRLHLTERLCQFTLKLFVILAFLSTNPVFSQNTVPLRRTVSPQQPMYIIHIDTWNYANPQKIIDLIPADIRPYVVMNISLSISHDVATSRFKVAEYGYEVAKSWLRVCAENRMWTMIQCASGGFSQFSDTDLSVYEEFYKNYPNFLGFNYAEQFWGFDDSTDPLSPGWSTRINHLTNLLQLSNKYGGYLVVSWCGNQWSPSINPIGMLKRNPQFAAASAQYKQNYVLCEKYTTRSYKFDMESVTLGAYLSGYSGNYGIRYDDTGWYDDNGNHAGFTMATAGAPVLEHAMLTGQTVIDGPELIWTQCFKELSSALTSDGYRERKWGTYDQFSNVSIDLFRKIIDGHVRIPTRQEVISRTKVAIINNVSSGNGDAIYSSPQTLFDGLYRMDNDGTYQDNLNFFKKSGRYPTIPTVFQLNDYAANSFQVKINKSDYVSRWPSTNSKMAELDALFPQEYTGNIYAGRHENGWVIYNPFRNGQQATGNIPFKYNTSESMDLTLSQYTSGVIKETANQLKIYLNNYDNVLNTGLKTDMIRIHGSGSKPAWSFTDRAAHQPSTVTEDWSKGILTLTIAHNGPLDITINCSGNATGRLTQYTASNIISPALPPVYLGTRQYEMECLEYKNIGPITTSGYSGNVRNYHGQGYIQFGTNAAAAVRKNITNINGGNYNLQIRYSLGSGRVDNIGLFVNNAQVATMSFTSTGSSNTWNNAAQNITLNSGTNSIELRALSSNTNLLYLDEMTVSPANAGQEIWLEAECGTVGSLWQGLQSSTASSGRYITITAGNNSLTNAPSNQNGIATYNLNIPVSGTYNVWGRLRAPSADDDSFWVKIDNGNWQNINGLKSSNVWTWDVLATANLSAGSHTLQIGYREDGTNLDKLYIGTNYPTEYGGNSTNCQSFLAVKTPALSRAETVIYPNPAKNELNIRYGNGVVNGDDINIYSSSGQLILRSKISSETERLDIAQLPAGVYLIKIGQSNKSLKFIKE